MNRHQLSCGKKARISSGARNDPLSSGNKCSRCNSSFASKFSLKRHLLVCTGKQCGKTCAKPFRCSMIDPSELPTRVEHNIGHLWNVAFSADEGQTMVLEYLKTVENAGCSVSEETSSQEIDFVIHTFDASSASDAVLRMANPMSNASKIVSLTTEVTEPDSDAHDTTANASSSLNLPSAAVYVSDDSSTSLLSSSSSRAIVLSESVVDSEAPTNDDTRRRFLHRRYTIIFDCIDHNLRDMSEVECAYVINKALIKSNSHHLATEAIKQKP